MREREGYREILADLREHFGPNHNLLTAKDVALYCGCDTRTAVKRYDIPKGGILMINLARRMCQ